MAGKQAKTINERDFERLLSACVDTRYPERNIVACYLSYKAGLRAVEMAKIKRRNVMSSDGLVDWWLRLEDSMCKRGSGRSIPMHPYMRTAIIELFKKVPGCPNDPLLLSERSMTNPSGDDPDCFAPKSISILFKKLYDKVGLIGCSSHSGRRTFITRAARDIPNHGGSLRDIQKMAGHKSLATTEGYIDINADAMRSVIDAMN
jgi:integrase